jgi:hypothetical protein
MGGQCMVSWRMDAPVDLGLDLDLELDLILGLGILLLPDAAPRTQSGSVAIVVASHSVEISSNFFSGLSPSLCVVTTSGWPNWDRLTVVIPSQIVWLHYLPRPLTSSHAVPCMCSIPPVRESRGCPSLSS